MAIVSKEKHSFDLFEKVYAITSRIPYGKVASYGQIAVLLGNARMARLVGWALHSLLENQRDVPWHRVINSKGYISTTCREHSFNEQRMLLMNEGIRVEEKEGMYWVDLKTYLWVP